VGHAQPWKRRDLLVSLSHFLFHSPGRGHATSTQHAEMGSGRDGVVFSAMLSAWGAKKKARLFLWPSSPGPASSALVGADRQRSASALVHASMRDLNKDRKHPCFFRAERICCHTTCAGARHGRQAGRRNRGPLHSLFLTD
jgi:hypothetical protein